MTDARAEITQLLRSLDGDAPEQLHLLFDRLYNELHTIAARRMRAERADHTLSATALVSEAYLKLSKLDEFQWKNRAQFFAVAARAMRRILVSQARVKAAEKRGGAAQVVTLTVGMAQEPASAELSWAELLTAEAALEELYGKDERQGRVAELRLYGGLTHPEIAEALEISTPTVERDWRVARAFLSRALG